MLKLEQALLVEGKYDAARLSNIVDGTILTTDGFRVFRDAALQKLLKRIAAVQGLIILTDSDAAGFKIRHYVTGLVGAEHVLQAYVPALPGKEARKAEPGKEGLKAFEGVDVAELRGEITKLQGQLSEQADSFAFDSALDAAIHGAHGRDVKAIRGMLDVAALKASKDRTSDIKAAVEALAKEKAWAFEDIGSGYPNVPDGGSAGAGGGTPAADGVEAAFKGMNPGLNV